MLTPAPLVEWGFQMEVFMPNFDNACLVKLPMEFAFRGANGGVKDRKTGDPEGTLCAVSCTYFCNNVHGQIWGHDGICTIASHFGLIQPFLWTRMKCCVPMLDTVRNMRSKSTFLHNIKNRRHKSNRSRKSGTEFQFKGCSANLVMESVGS